MTKKSFAVVVVLFAIVYLGLGAYLDRPTVEVSVDTGHCVRAYGPNGPMPCDDATSGSYEKVFVDPKRFKKVLRG
ncbi:MAG: hypothetical protein UU88_C0002G0001 [Parcubacteria group bacterium GW2011_GWC1_42_11]|uniref:Uncharacterized protein n=1 Tax=Candidatus Nomurabacteria bacterium GW2011_GWC2_42_20 TaxID=1618756 RepID=A0A0G1CE29_9BACT|nr:MAG: hypothetical protein UU88_C0002G0001 [Parcubacteria group bacterium GW2011_GWC1_42_11]KKS47898.1 MAG: hypothetical protein UV12_C0004G0006 [Candidatus Nomurabacteria bacterium GW2011_GWC2_42_20]KKS58507.1 MAG: hypothetical protein UV24_C0021G0002 [Candidatus Nomurabacteria bacterium GW2011_GWA2_42_41]KKT09665.1 MAG: hypothetical protein UV86_C0003G0001 [Candidatus Nomurabacteria bacterium GW2011_GWB1_43_20]TAN36606.1 MAG: hypothetical protein EPN27_01155 [Patescibacteria group bacterium